MTLSTLPLKSSAKHKDHENTAAEKFWIADLSHTQLIPTGKAEEKQEGCSQGRQKVGAPEGLQQEIRDKEERRGETGTNQPPLPCRRPVRDLQTQVCQGQARDLLRGLPHRQGISRKLVPGARLIP